MNTIILRNRPIWRTDNDPYNSIGHYVIDDMRRSKQIERARMGKDVKSFLIMCDRFTHKDVSSLKTQSKGYFNHENIHRITARPSNRHQYTTRYGSHTL